MTLAVATPARAALTEGPRLAAIYDSILRARFGQAEQRLVQACPPAPVEACRALAIVALWWQILLDPESRRLDARLERAAAAAIAAAEAWTRREPGRAEAWFYLAGAYAPLVQWRVLRAERLAAAREGKKIKDALERALALDATLHDAYFGIGLYHYYADVAPAALKVVRWLLLLPGGDRVQGLREMLQARDARRAPRGRSRLPAALAVSLVRAQAGDGAGAAAGSRRALSVEPDFPPADRRSSARILSRPRRRHGHVGDAAGACARCGSRRRTHCRSARATRTCRGAHRTVATPIAPSGT